MFGGSFGFVVCCPGRVCCSTCGGAVGENLMPENDDTFGLKMIGWSLSSCLQGI